MGFKMFLRTARGQVSIMLLIRQFVVCSLCCWWRRAGCSSNICYITSNLQQSWGAEVSKRERDYRKEWCVVDFCTRHACASVERHFSECTNSTNQAGISTSHYFSLEIYSSQHFSLGISTSEYFSLEISSGEETNPKLTLFSQLSYWNLYFLLTFLVKSLLSLYFLTEIFTFS